MKTIRPSPRPAFTLIELLVVIAIIAILAALIFPVMSMVQRRSIETRANSNLRQIGAAMGSYIGEHNDTLPGPLTVEQYPTFGTDPKKDEGSLAKLLAPYLGLSALTGDAKNVTREGDVFACVGAKAKNLDEVPGYVMNMEIIPDYDQPAWGDLKKQQEPMRRSALSAWRDTSATAASSDAMVMLPRKWAMRHTDKKDAGKLGLTGEWVEKLPEEPVFDDHYQALYFDLHVDILKPTYETKN